MNCFESSQLSVYAENSAEKGLICPYRHKTMHFLKQKAAHIFATYTTYNKSLKKTKFS